MTDSTAAPQLSRHTAKHDSGAVRSRERIAKLEIGHTAISRAQCRVLVIVFLLVIGIVPVVQVLEDSHSFARGLRASALPSCLEMARDVRKSLGRLFRPTDPSDPAVANGGAFARLREANDSLQKDAARHERRLADESWLTRASLPRIQPAFTDVLGVGNEQVYLGLSGWLFYRPDVEHLTARGFLEWRRLLSRWREGTASRPGPQPDPVLAILHFQAQLASRGICLVVVPTPSKAAIYPERFSSRVEVRGEALANASFGQFVAEIQNPEAFLADRMVRYRRQGQDPAFREARTALNALEQSRSALRQVPIRVFDPRASLMAGKLTGRGDQFLRTDTHWTPSGVDGVAQSLAAFLRDAVDLPAGTLPDGRRSVPVTSIGDTAAMLGLPEGHPVVRREGVITHRVSLDISGSDELTTVLLLGDSYSNVYSDAGLGWGEGAGLADQLGHHLGMRVGRIALNGGGAHASRVELARRLQSLEGSRREPGASRRDDMGSVRVIVYQFAERELSDGDWKLVELPRRGALSTEGMKAPPVGTPPVQGNGAPGTSETVLVGEVLATSRLPAPFSAPYGDCLTTWLLRVERVESGNYDDDTVLVVALGMKDNVWLSSASVVPGDKRRMRLIPLRRASPEIRSTQRVDDTKDLSHLPYFALTEELP